MSISNEITFCGYKITARAERYTHEYWAAGFIVEKNGEVIRKSEFVTCRNTEIAAESGALLKGIQYVDLFLKPIEEIEALQTKVFGRAA